jgi:hypothetical protein
VGVGDDVRAGGLTEDGAQAGDRGDAAGDDVAQYVAGADGGKLVYVADQQQVGAGFEGFEQVVGEQQVEHGGFVHHQQSTGRGLSALCLKPSAG